MVYRCICVCVGLRKVTLHVVSTVYICLQYERQRGIPGKYTTVHSVLSVGR